MEIPRVFADFHNSDPQGRLRLNTVGTMEDLADQKVALREGLVLTLHSEDLEVQGKVRHSTEEGFWVAVIDWDAISRSTGEDRVLDQRKLPEPGAHQRPSSTTKD